MLEDIAPYLLLGGLFFCLEYAYDRWNSRAPTPEGLFHGEKLIAGLRTWLTIDDAPRAGFGFAYLTDLRLVWTPNVGAWGRWHTPPGPLYDHPVIVELTDVRKVDARFRLGGSRLILETPDVRLEFWVDGRSFGFWERYILSNARNLLPKEQPVLRARDRYSRQEVLASSRGAAVFMALLTLYFGAEVLRAAVDIGGDSLSDTQLIGMIVAVVALGLAALAWYSRPSH